MVDKDPSERDCMNRSRYLPPLPVEHGARSLLVVALLLPVSVAFGPEGSWTGTSVLSYLLFAIVAVGTMLLREAMRRYGLTSGTARHRILKFAVAESLVVVAAIGGLVALRGMAWVSAVGVFPAVAFELRFREQGRAGSFLDVAAGVLGLSLLVPVGASLLGVGSPVALSSLFLLFAGFHLLAIHRVMTAMKRARQSNQSATSGILAPVIALAAVVVGWQIGWVGLAGPVLFTISTVRTVQLLTAAALPPTKRIGQTEAVLSALFVLGGAWLLP
jgi:hypothetical protein